LNRISYCDLDQTAADTHQAIVSLRAGARADLPQHWGGGKVLMKAKSSLHNSIAAIPYFAVHCL